MRPKSSFNSHIASNVTRKVSTSHQHPQSSGWKSGSVSSKSKENDNSKGKGKLKAISSSTSALGPAFSSDRFESLVKNLKKAHSEAVKSSSGTSTGSSSADPQVVTTLTSTAQRDDISTTQPANASSATRFARSADFPLSNSAVWCGPTPRQKVGRPKTKDEPLGRKRRDHVPLPVPGNGVSPDRQVTNVEGAELETQTQMTLDTLLAVLSSAAAVDRGTNDALLTALGAIDSSSSDSGGMPNVGLANALKELLSAACNANNLPAPPSQPAAPTTTNYQRKRSSSDTDEIIILDKENVNPGAFKRKGEKRVGSSDAKTGNVRERERGREKQRVGLEEHSENGVAAGRKRTLSDFMEEKERERERQQERERARRESGGGRNRAGTGSSSLLSSSSVENRVRGQGQVYSDMDYPFSSHASSSNRIAGSTAARPHTSPPRPTSAHPFQRIAPSYAATSTSPTGPTPVPLLSNPPRKYVVPAWARTNTTTQPRLSKEAMAQKAAAEAEAEAERKRKKRASRRHLENDAGNNGAGSKKKTSSVPVKRPQVVMSSNAGSKDASSMSLPVCASDVPVVPPSSSSPPCEDEGSNPAMYSSQEAPKTPPPRSRRRHMLTPLTKSDGASGGSALFTPTPRKLFGDGSPLFSPSLSTNKKSKPTPMSPLKALTTGRGWDADEEEAGVDEEEEERLSRELDEALEELDVPPSSLPIASSDFDNDPLTTSSSIGTGLDSQEDQVMPYWTTGLPPSSPPPPSSPILQSQTDDEDMDDFSNAMSDSDGLIFDHEPQQDQRPFSGDSSDFNNSDFLFTDDLAMCFNDFNKLFSDPMTSTINPQDTSLSSSDPVVQNGIADFDFSQFWESVKPLVDHQSMTTLPDGSASDGVQEMAEIDHVKLAEEVHALFSGCLM